MRKYMDATLMISWLLRGRVFLALTYTSWAFKLGVGLQKKI